MLLVFSTETGELLGWMPDGYLQRTRVGALYALAADYLARPDAEEVGLIGSGWQAGGQILGLRCVRDIKKVRVFSSNADRRNRVADALGNRNKACRCRAGCVPDQMLPGSFEYALKRNSRRTHRPASFRSPLPKQTIQGTSYGLYRAIERDDLR